MEFPSYCTRKKAEIDVLNGYQQKFIILESIGKEYFVVDKSGK